MNLFLNTCLLISALAAAAPVSVAAQQSLDESIAVDGKYAAEVIRMERLAAFPADFPTEMVRHQLDYDLKPISADFSPSLFSLPFAAFAPEGKRGYLDAAVGSWLDSRLDAGGWFLQPSASGRWKAGAWLKHRGTALWRPESRDGIHFPRRKDFSEDFGVVAANTLRGGSRLTANLEYGLHYFNYFMTPDNPSQTVNSIKGSVAWSSAPFARLEHLLSVGVSYFGYRNMPLAFADGYPAPSRETVVELSGAVSSPVENGAVGADNRMALSGTASGVFGASGGSYGLVSVVPSYSFVWNGVHVNAGANIDFSVKAGSASDPFSAIHIAPAVKVWLPSSHFTFYANVMGGSELQTLRNRSQLSRWVSPCEFSHTPLFSPVDASVGFNAGPAEGALRGLEGGLQVRYKAVSHLPFYGWFPTALAAGQPYGAELMALNSGVAALHGFEFSGKIAWSLRSLFKAGVNVAYSPQNNSRGFFNGIDRARWTADASLAVKPVERLSLAVAADWKGVRYVYGCFTTPGAQQGVRLPDWVSAKLEADWTFSSELSFGCGVCNFTNRKNIVLPEVPAEGVVVAARLNWIF